MNFYMNPKFFLTLVAMALVGGCVFNCDDYLTENISPMTIRGIVLKKQERQTECFGSIFVEELTKKDTLRVCYCVVENQDVWSYILPNDSLYKEEGSLKLRVVRKGQEKLFDYPCCAQ